MSTPFGKYFGRAKEQEEQQPCLPCHTERPHAYHATPRGPLEFTLRTPAKLLKTLEILVAAAHAAAAFFACKMSKMCYNKA